MSPNVENRLPIDTVSCFKITDPSATSLQTPNKTFNVTLRRVRATIVAAEKQ